MLFFIGSIPVHGPVLTTSDIFDYVSLFGIVVGVIKFVFVITSIITVIVVGWFIFQVLKTAFSLIGGAFTLLLFPGRALGSLSDGLSGGLRKTADGDWKPSVVSVLGGRSRSRGSRGNYRRYRR